MKILIVSYFFPPYNTIGAVRVGKLAKYLVRQGHEVKVLTAKDQPLPPHLPVEIDEGNVIRTSWFNVNWLPEKVLGGRERVAKEGFSVNSSLRTVLKQAGLLYKTLLNFPDGQIGWYLPALKAGKQLIRYWRPDVIYASASPYTSLLVASSLASKSGIPWIAELRDLWVDHHYYQYGPWRKLLESWLEREVLSSAQGIVTVSEPLAQVLRSKYSQPVAVILNGFDPDDFRGLRRHDRDNDSLTRIVYTGTIYEGKRDPSPLFSALSALSKEVQSRIYIYFYGRYLEPVRELGRRYGIEHLVVTHPAVPYKRALELQAEADVLLLLLWNDPKEKGVYTGKLFEYIGAGRPILAVGPKDNVAAELINKYGFGMVVSSTDEAYEALKKIIHREPPFNQREFDQNTRMRFSREKRAIELIQFLESILGIR